MSWLQVQIYSRAWQAWNKTSNQWDIQKRSCPSQCYNEEREANPTGELEHQPVWDEQKGKPLSLYTYKTLAKQLPVNLVHVPHLWHSATHEGLMRTEPTCIQQHGREQSCLGNHLLTCSWCPTIARFPGTQPGDTGRRAAHVPSTRRVADIRDGNEHAAPWQSTELPGRASTRPGIQILEWTPRPFQHISVSASQFVKGNSFLAVGAHSLLMRCSKEVTNTLETPEEIKFPLSFSCSVTNEAGTSNWVRKKY